MKIISQSKTQRHQCGLTLVEMLVATTLLVVIMLGLTAMFNQTQRAFQSGLKQVDVFEGGRAVMDMITRDIEQAVSSRSPEDWSFVAGLPPFAASLEQNFLIDQGRTNILYETYFLNKTTDWNAIGYRVVDQNDVDATGLIYGSLYRFSTNFPQFNSVPLNEHYKTFTQDSSTLTNQSLTRVADGIVHFRLRFYNDSGALIPPRDVDGRVIYNSPNFPPDVALFTPPQFPEEPTVVFSNSVPAMVEVELGILEPMTLKQANSISDATARRRYLEKQAGKVHIFKQQIPIRTSRSWR